MLNIDGKIFHFYKPAESPTANARDDIPYGFASPKEYVQAFGLRKQLPKLVSRFGKQPLIMITSSLFDRLSTEIIDAFEPQHNPIIMRFNGLCCEEEIKRIKLHAESNGADAIIGIGGGNLLDTAKFVAAIEKLPLILMPSVASCDAATSAMSIVNDSNGVYRGGVFHPERANIIAVDTELILQSPERLFVAGMGDALATYFEARAGLPTGALNYVSSGYHQTLLGQYVAKATYDILMEHGREALNSFRAGTMDSSLNAVIENNILISGLGFENTCCSIAHGMHGTLGHYGTKKTYHGEKVAFGLLCQLQLEDCPLEEFNSVFSFCRDVGLPLTLSAFGIGNDPETVRIIAESTIKGSFHIKNEPFSVTEKALTKAILSADMIGRQG